MKDLKEIKELQEMEGLSKSAHKSLEEIVKNIKRGESPLLTLAEAEGGGGYE